MGIPITATYEARPPRASVHIHEIAEKRAQQMRAMIVSYSRARGRHRRQKIIKTWLLQVQPGPRAPAVTA